MAKISLIKPLDQPVGRSRLINHLMDCLCRDDFQEFKFMVAYAKLSPLIKLAPHIKTWMNSDRTIFSIFGIDQNNTSVEALSYSLENFSNVYIAHTLGRFSPTFHPKFYLFKGDKHAIAFIGSNNLTVGGTETNFEYCTRIEMTLPEDSSLLNEFEQSWDEVLNYSIKLNAEVLDKMMRGGLILTEAKMRKSASKAAEKRNPSGNENISLPEFPVLKIKPPLPIPKSILKKSKPKVAEERRQDVNSSISSLVIQIIPHHNGEIFLSKTAVNQNPQFFGWPFEGKTTPKKEGNPSYPQRLPDPIVNITVFDSSGNEIIKHINFGLNTVYYEPKAEIRITVPQDVIGKTTFTEPPYSLMLISKAPPGESNEYEIDIYVPGSLPYEEYLSICNQTMPSGGKATPRRFGWI